MKTAEKDFGVLPVFDQQEALNCQSVGQRASFLRSTAAEDGPVSDGPLLDAYSNAITSATETVSPPVVKIDVHKRRGQW